MIWLILILALFLRLINLSQSLWLDEAINVVFARSSSFWWFITKYPIGDFHPPGWFVLLWIWGHFFGFSEMAVRLPSVILGIASVGLTFLLGKELFSKKVGLLAAFLLSIAPLHIYYSQEARMYVLAVFSTTLSFYFLNRLILQKKYSSIGFVLSLVLVLSSDYLAYFVILAQIFYLIWTRKMCKDILINFLISIILFSPWFFIFPVQLEKGINTASVLPGWANVVGSSIKDLTLIPIKTIFGRVTFLDKTFYIVAVSLAGVLYGSVFLRGLKKMDNATKLLLSWIFIPLIFSFLISFFIPILAYFRMIFILPAFYLILSKSLLNLPKKIVGLAAILICIVSIASLLGYYINPKFQREDWRGAVNFVSSQLNNQTLVIFENNEVPSPVVYYRNDLSNFKPGILDNLEGELKGKNKVFVFEYLVDVYDPKKIVERKLKSLSFIQIKTYDFSGVGFVKLYTK